MRQKETADNLDLGDREVGDRLDHIIDESRLNPTWVMDRIEDYYNGNDHIGRWQQLAKDHRWNKLAAKLAVDNQQLEEINSAVDMGSSRRCNIMSNICNTKRQFFKRLDGAQDFELSEKGWRMNEEEDERTSRSAPIASRMEEEDERTSHSLPTISVSAVNEVMRRRSSF